MGPENGEFIVVKALEDGVNFIGMTRGRDTRLQHTEKLLEKQEMAQQQQTEPVAAPEKPFGVVSVCAGDGLAAVFREDVYKRQEY